MLEHTITIINKLGLHARAAAKLVKTAANYQSTIQLQVKQRSVNAKSIMGVMMLAASKGTDVTFIIEGEDAEQALQALCELINNRFDEEE